MNKFFTYFSCFSIFSITVFALFNTNTKISTFLNYYLVGSSSLFLYKFSTNYFLIFIKILVLFLISISNYRYILIIPFFLIHILTNGSDFLFLLPLLFSLQTKNITIRTITFCIIALLRQLFIEPNPSIGLLWLIDSHQITEFHDITRIIICFFQIFLLFISRYTKEDLFPISVFVIFDPALDFSLLSFILYFSFKYLHNNREIQIAYSFLFVGIIFNQASFFSWLKMNIGNPNFTMVGSILVTIAFGIIMIFDKTNIEKEKKD